MSTREGSALAAIGKEGGRRALICRSAWTEREYAIQVTRAELSIANVEAVHAGRVAPASAERVFGCLRWGATAAGSPRWPSPRVTDGISLGVSPPLN